MSNAIIAQRGERFPMSTPHADVEPLLVAAAAPEVEQFRVFLQSEVGQEWLQAKLTSASRRVQAKRQHVAKRLADAIAANNPVLREQLEGQLADLDSQLRPLGME